MRLIAEGESLLFPASVRQLGVALPSGNGLRTSRVSAPSATPTRTRVGTAPACRSTLVSASWRMR